MPSLNLIELVGGLAGVLTTVAFVPQVVKVIRTKSTGDLSLGMCLIFSVGIALWLVYGIFIGSRPVILANAVTLVLTSILVWYKLKYG